MSTDATPLIEQLLSQFVEKASAVEDLVDLVKQLMTEQRGEQRAEQRILDALEEDRRLLTQLRIDLTKLQAVAEIQVKAEEESREVRRQLWAPLLDKWPYAVTVALASMGTWLATWMTG